MHNHANSYVYIYIFVHILYCTPKLSMIYHIDSYLIIIIYLHMCIYYISQHVCPSPSSRNFPKTKVQGSGWNGRSHLDSPVTTITWFRRGSQPKTLHFTVTGEGATPNIWFILSKICFNHFIFFVTCHQEDLWDHAAKKISWKKHIKGDIHQSCCQPS